MGTFGEDLRTERLSRGIALEDITAVTKISQRHLLALEQEHFRLLPGGILNKGIVRGYASALGLDQEDWTSASSRPTAPPARCSTTTAVGRHSPPTSARPASSAARPVKFASAGWARCSCSLVVGRLRFLRRPLLRRPRRLVAYRLPRPRRFSAALHSTWSWVHHEVSRVTAVFGS